MSLTGHMQMDIQENNFENKKFKEEELTLSWKQLMSENMFPTKKYQRFFYKSKLEVVGKIIFFDIKYGLDVFNVI